MVKQCGQCEALYINGLFCHEHGCPNGQKRWVDGDELSDGRRYDGVRDAWTKTAPIVSEPSVEGAANMGTPKHEAGALHALLAKYGRGNTAPSESHGRIDSAKVGAGHQEDEADDTEEIV